ncbi:hypothetical protein BI296_10940 [Mycobacterium avium subsp. hominissuis]|nr:hypothetical protein BI296_10940 [Mycobacterium avium subsp. hominissuis]
MLQDGVRGPERLGQLRGPVVGAVLPGVVPCGGAPEVAGSSSPGGTIASPSVRSMPSASIAAPSLPS